MMFFLDEKLYKKIKLVKSDDSIVAFDFQEEERVWLPVRAVLKNYKRAFTMSQAANMLSVTNGLVREVVNEGKVTSPVLAYNPRNFAPRGYYISEENMMELRDVIWDLLPKNKYGEPFKDTMPSPDDLKARLHSEDERNYVVRDNEFIQIFAI